MIQYLTGCSNDLIRSEAQSLNLGLLVTPDTAGAGAKARYDTHLSSYPVWAADNACFNHPETFNTDRFLSWLGEFSDIQRAHCLWAVAPDVVGDAVKTIERSVPVLPRIRAAGYKAAFVAQDGLENLTVPWSEFDALFIGGSTEWKLSDHAKRLCRAAKAHGKQVHMGRVNSYKRCAIAQDFGCDTADGTFLAFGPRTNLPRLSTWFDRLRQDEAIAEFQVA